MRNEEKNLLEIYDNLELNSKAKRRLGFRIMEDLYGKIITKKGVEKLKLRTTDANSFNALWSKVEKRFYNVDDVKAPGELFTVLETIGDVRNNISHDYTADVEKDNLDEMRKNYSKFKKWFNEALEKANQHYSNLDAKNMLEEEIRSSLVTAELTLDDESSFERVTGVENTIATNIEMKNKKESRIADRIKEYWVWLSSLKEKEEITKEHIQLLERAAKIEQDVGDKNIFDEEYLSDLGLYDIDTLN